MIRSHPKAVFQGFDGDKGLTRVGLPDGGESRQSCLSCADTRLFDNLIIPFLHGDPATALGDPHGSVISQSLARKYFPESSTLGQVIEIKDAHFGYEDDDRLPAVHRSGQALNAQAV